MKKNLIKSVAAATIFGLSTTAFSVPISGGFVPVPGVEGQSAFFSQYQGLNFEVNPSVPGTQGKIDIDAGLIAGIYFYNKNIEFFGILPYLRKSAKAPAFPIGGGVFAPVFITTEALSDPIIGTIVKLNSNMGKGWYQNTGIIASLGLPLATYNMAGIPSLFQPGTGNFVPTVGLTSSYHHVEYGMVTGNVSYAFPISGHGFKYPDVLQYNLSLAKRILPWSLPEDAEVPVTTELQLEFLGSKTGQFNTSNPALDGLPANTFGRGDLIKIAPGIAMRGVGWSIAATYAYPILQNLKGVQPFQYRDGGYVQFAYFLS
jgi:hypothetical protein